MSLSISEAAQRIRAGGLVAFPTETVYGLGANALDARAVQKIYELKGRPATSPLIVHVASAGMAREIVAEWPDLAQDLANRWWPGPLTMVLPKREVIPGIVTAGLSTVGVRMPAHPVALKLIEEAGVPIAAPSANKFTGISPTTPEHVRAAFGDAVEVLEGGPAKVGIESTVIAIERSGVKLLRPGMIHIDAARPAEPSEGAHPAPGMHQRHYSPRTPLVLVDGPEDLGDRTGAYIWHSRPAVIRRSIHLPAEPAAFAARLYSALHELDAENWPWIAVQLPPPTPEWQAIHDRLRRAAGQTGAKAS